MGTRTLLGLGIAALLAACGGDATDADPGPGLSDVPADLGNDPADPDPGLADEGPRDVPAAEDGPPDPGPEDVAPADDGATDVPPPDGPPEVVDPQQDSDRDGIPDLQELDDGTDPDDPSSARAWHPEWTGHPRLFFDADDLPVLRARTQATEGPHPTLWARILARAAQSYPVLDLDGYENGLPWVAGETAECAAFAGLLLEDPARIAKALEGIAAPFPDPTGLPVESHYDLIEAQALVSLCTAFDYAAASPLADATALAAARANLLARLDTFRWMSHEGSAALMLMTTRNNHTMKAFGAMGICALVLNDRPEAAVDVGEAMTGMDFLLHDWQSTPEGGYGDGWHYLTYGGASFLPFLAAYHRWADGRTFPYYGVPLLQAGSPHAERIVEIPDFAVNPRTRTVYRTALQARQPDGLQPPTDDANAVGMHGGLLAWFFDDAAFLSGWTPANGLLADNAQTATFALFDTPAAYPAGTALPLEVSLPLAGFAVIRSDWTDAATYLLVQGEQGNVRLSGQGHEHPDELSFVFWSGGDPLVLDPGYINWANRSRVNAPSDHNTILVDGEGSPGDPTGLGMDVGVDAFLGPIETSDDGALRAVTVRTAYRGVRFARRLVVAGGDLVVEDRIDAAAPHDYALLLNTPADPQDLRTEGPGAVGWVADGVEARVAIAALEGEATVLGAGQEVATGYGQWVDRVQLRAQATMAGTPGFLTVVHRAGPDEAPLAVDRPAPGVATVTIEGPSCRRLVALNATAAPWVGAVATFPPGLSILDACTGQDEVAHRLAPFEP